MASPPRPHIRLFIILTAAMVVLPALATPRLTGEAVCGGRVRVVAPEGWQLSQAGEAGAVLRPPDPQGTPIEIVGWDVPRGGEPSALSAATAQETLLQRRSAYARVSTRDYTTAAGVTGLLVVGQVRGADAKLQDAVFAAFVQQGRYYIIGTFAPEGAAPAALEGPFGNVLKSLEFEQPAPAVVAKVEPPPVAAPLPVLPMPAAPVAPVVSNPANVALPAPTPTPALPVVEQPVVTITPSGPTSVAPAAPPAPPPAPELVRHVSPLGYQLEHPTGWNVAVAGGRIEVTSPVGDGSTVPGAMAVIWPLTAVPQAQDATAVARQLLQKWPPTAVGAAGLSARVRGETVVLAGTVGPGGKQRRVVACCQVRNGTGILTAILSRPEEFAANLPALTAILGSFEGGPWWTTKTAGETPSTLWRDPAAKALQATVPAGWKVRGGTQQYNGSWSIFVELTSTDSRHLSVTWQQPLAPQYRELTTVLRNLGWQESDKYVSNPGDQPLRILSRLSPQDYLTREWLPNGTLRLQDAVIDRLDSRAEAAALVTGANPAAVAALLHGNSEFGARQRLCVIATADAAARIGTNCWQAAVLQADAPVGDLDEALAVLRDVVTSAELAPDGPQQAGSAIRLLLQGAERALVVLPEKRRPDLPAKEVLTALAPKGKGELWLLSPEALDCWQWAARRLQQGQECAESLPELQQSFWK